MPAPGETAEQQKRAASREREQFPRSRVCGMSIGDPTPDTTIVTEDPTSPRPRGGNRAGSVGSMVPLYALKEAVAGLRYTRAAHQQTYIEDHQQVYTISRSVRTSARAAAGTLCANDGTPVVGLLGTAGNNDVAPFSLVDLQQGAYFFKFDFHQNKKRRVFLRLAHADDSGRLELQYWRKPFSGGATRGSWRRSYS